MDQRLVQFLGKRPLQSQNIAAGYSGGGTGVQTCLQGQNAGIQPLSAQSRKGPQLLGPDGEQDISRPVPQPRRRVPGSGENRRACRDAALLPQQPEKPDAGPL